MRDDYSYDLGSYSRPVTTGSADAQRWFDRGLVWCFAYNHDEAIFCFQQALAHDPACAMAHWGIAYAAGPNYNKPWMAFDDEDKRRTLAQVHAAAEGARRHADAATPVERDLIAALEHRYPPTPVDDFAPWNDAYADAMRKVHAAHPADADVAALFAESIMNRTPWQLWDLGTGKPAAGASTAEAIAVLEDGFAKLDGAWRHPGLLHMYIHLMEMSPHPERALKAGDALAGLVPDAGHLRHMATHIDVLCGQYHNVVVRNMAATIADRKFLAHRGAANFYSLYRCHNHHFRIYGAMFLGQVAPAIEAADEMVASLPREVLTITSPPMADWLEGFVPMRQHVLIRFGKWHDILDQTLPDDPALFCVTTAMMQYARTVAFSALGRVAEAEGALAEFEAAVGRVPESRMLFNNTCRDILNIAHAMALGELEYRRGNHDLAFAHLRRSVELDDSLPYDEPWGWMQPTRHALGALLLEQGRFDEAEAVYRADLGLGGTLPRACQHPDNLWSLHGLHECLARRGATAEAAIIAQRLAFAQARADTPIRASCFCRMTRAA